jgi:hypothetical protein
MMKTEKDTLVQDAAWGLAKLTELPWNRLTTIS